MFQFIFVLVLINKLLTSCPNLTTIYLLVRSKNNKSVDTRVDEMFADPVNIIIIIRKYFLCDQNHFRCLKYLKHFLQNIPFT